MNGNVAKRSEPKVTKGGIIQASIKVDSRPQEMISSTTEVVWPRVEKYGRYRSTGNSDYYDLREANHRTAHERREQSVSCCGGIMQDD